MPSQFRYFPAEAFLFGLIGLGFLSWTNEVHWFRLQIPGLFEHALCYMLVGFTLLAAKGSFRLTLFEILIVIVFAGLIEALKAGVPFRHPKTSDYFADMAGFLFSLFCASMVERSKVALFKVIRNVFRFS